MPSTAVSTATASGTASDGPGEFRIAATACWRYWSRCGIGEDLSAGSDVNAASRLVMVDNSFRTVAAETIRARPGSLRACARVSSAPRRLAVAVPRAASTAVRFSGVGSATSTSTASR